MRAGCVTSGCRANEGRARICDNTEQYLYSAMCLRLIRVFMLVDILRWCQEGAVDVSSPSPPISATSHTAAVTLAGGCGSPSRVKAG